MSNRLQLTVLPEQSGQRIDKFLQEALPELSRSQAQKWLAQGMVELDGAPAGKNDRLKSGAQLSVLLPQAVQSSLAKDIKTPCYAISSVIIPQIKHANSLATATMATFRFAPFFSVIR